MENFSPFWPSTFLRLRKKSKISKKEKNFDFFFNFNFDDFDVDKFQFPLYKFWISFRFHFWWFWFWLISIFTYAPFLLLHLSSLYRHFKTFNVCLLYNNVLFVYYFDAKNVGDHSRVLVKKKSVFVSITFGSLCKLAVFTLPLISCKTGCHEWFSSKCLLGFYNTCFMKHIELLFVLFYYFINFVWEIKYNSY